jgi:hypothetical protein
MCFSHLYIHTSYRSNLTWGVGEKTWEWELVDLFPFEIWRKVVIQKITTQGNLPWNTMNPV